MTAHNDIGRYVRGILTNAFAEKKIDFADLNIIQGSAMPYLSESDKMVVDWTAYSHDKWGKVLQAPIVECYENPPVLIAAINGIYPTGEITPELVHENTPDKLRKKLIDALQRESGATFPMSVMTGAAGDFAHLYSSYMEVPKQFLYMSFLTCLGSVLSDKLTIDSEIRPQPRLYLVLLGESADDRKSSAISKTVYFFKDAIGGFEVCWGVGSAEGLQKKMEGNKQLLLAYDEFAALVGSAE
jgi:hypothetical protein